MKLDLKFSESVQKLDLNFGQYQDLTDGGFERGYNEGKQDGYTSGYEEGYTKGDSEGYDKGYGKGAIPLRYAEISTIAYWWASAIFPENTELVLHFKNSLDAHTSAFRHAKNLKTLKLVADNIKETPTNLFGLAQNTPVELLDFTEYNRKAKNFNNFADGCTELKSILGAFDVSACTIFSGSFAYASKLEDVEFVPNTIKVSISFSACPLLSPETIQSIIDGLADLTEQTAQTLTLHAEVGAKLTDEQKAVITAKNWILAY